MKILALLLALGLMFAQSSCTVLTGGEDGGSKKEDEENTNLTPSTGEAPRIVKIMGDGADGRIHSSVIVEGENFTKDTLVTISNDDDSVELLVDYEGDFKIIAMVPPVIKTGIYKLQVENENGDDEVDVQVLQGEPGTAGAQGEKGLACWDNNNDGEGQPEEDMNADGEYNAYDCKGVQGEPGKDGKDGENGDNGKTGSAGEAGDDADIFKITSEPPLFAVPGDQYLYQVTANDPLNPNYNYYFFLASAPEGMMVDYNGKITWDASDDLLGQRVQVTVQAFNADFAVAEQTFFITVGEEELSGFSIISEAPSEGYVNMYYDYYVSTYDPKDPWGQATIKVVSSKQNDSPRGDTAMIFNVYGNLIQFFPMSNDVGNWEVSIEAKSTDGKTKKSQTFFFEIKDGLPPPTEFAIISAPPTTATASEALSYQLSAYDPAEPDYTAFTYKLFQGPEGVSVTQGGLLTWTPSDAQTGWQYIEVQAFNRTHLTASQGIWLNVYAAGFDPDAMSIYSTPYADPMSVYLSWPYFYYYIGVNDPVDPYGYTRTFDITGDADWLFVDAWGSISLAEGATPSPGVYSFTVTVTNTDNNESVSQVFTVEIVNDLPTNDPNDWNAFDGSCIDSGVCYEYYGFGYAPTCNGTWSENDPCPGVDLFGEAYLGMCAYGYGSMTGTITFEYDDNPEPDIASLQTACEGWGATWTSAN